MVKGNKAQGRRSVCRVGGGLFRRPDPLTHTHTHTFGFC